MAELTLANRLVRLSYLTYIKPEHKKIIILILVSSLMRGGAGGMSAASQMSGLGCGGEKSSSAVASAVASAMQFPLSQRRKRRVLFTQAQVGRDLRF